MYYLWLLLAELSNQSTVWSASLEYFSLGLSRRKLAGPFFVSRAVLFLSCVLKFVSEQRDTSVLSLCLKDRGGCEDTRTSSFRLSPLYPALSCVCFGAVWEFQPPLCAVVSRHILNKMQNIEKENLTENLRLAPYASPQSETSPIRQSTEWRSKASFQGLGKAGQSCSYGPGWHALSVNTLIVGTWSSDDTLSPLPGLVVLQ